MVKECEKAYKEVASYDPGERDWDDAKATYRNILHDKGSVKGTVPSFLGSHDLRSDTDCPAQAKYIRRLEPFINAEAAFKTLRLDDDTIVSLRQLECLYFLQARPSSYLPPSLLAPVVLSDAVYTAHQDVKHAQDDVSGITSLCQNLVISPPEELAKMVCLTLETLLELKGPVTTAAFLVLLQDELREDESLPSLRNKLKEATTAELALVVAAFEAFCLFYPVGESAVEAKRGHDKEMDFLKPFIQLLRHRTMQVVNVSATMLSYARQPWLLTYLLDVCANSSHTPYFSLEEFIDHLVRIYKRDYPELDASHVTGRVIGYIVAYAVSEIERCASHDAPSQAFCILRTAFKGTMNIDH